jgi:hypothetical protein
VRAPEGANPELEAAAEEGTRLHGLCEMIVRDHKADTWDRILPALCGADCGLVTEALMPIHDVIVGNGLLPLSKLSGSDLPGPGEYGTEVGMVSKLTGRQRLDFLAIMSDGDTAVLADYKFVRYEPDVRLQMMAYADTVFAMYPNVNTVQLMAPAPKVFAADYHLIVSRNDMKEFAVELDAILNEVNDDFKPGRPGAVCCMCGGNGRCPWQAASLREIAMDPSIALVTKDQLLEPATPQDRGDRRCLIQWLGALCDAVKEQDKQWALDHPGADVLGDGWTVSLSLGRKTLDRRRSREACAILKARFMMTDDELLNCVVPDAKAITEWLSIRDAVSLEAAGELVRVAMEPVMTRGDPYPTMRRKISKEGKKKVLT